MTKRKKWGITIILLPGALLIFTLFLQLFVRFALTKTSTDNPCIDGTMVQTLEDMPTAECEDSTSSTSSPVKSLINVVSILFGMFSVLGFLPCLIIGIVLLATDSKNHDVLQQPAQYNQPQNTQQYTAPNPVVQSSQELQQATPDDRYTDPQQH